MQRATKCEQFHIYNSLVLLVKALEGEYTTVDLRDEAYVTGKIAEVDGFMNIEMEDCIFYNSRGVPRPFDTFYVKARNIRFVHIPKPNKAVDLMTEQLDKMKRNPTEKTKKPTFKTLRAKRYQAETESEIQQLS